VICLILQCDVHFMKWSFVSRNCLTFSAARKCCEGPDSCNSCPEVHTE